MIECVLDARAGIGEGAVWSAAEQVLWWVEILERKLHRYDPATGEDRIFPMPSFIGCVAPRAAGGLMVALQEGFGLFDPADGALTILPGYAPAARDGRFNDGAVSPDGRLFATTMRAAPPFDDPDQQLVALDPSGAIRLIEDGLMIGNGLAFSPDGRTMYLSDSHPSRRCVWAYDWDANEGIPRNKRLFFEAKDLPGHPDGAAIDQDGGYWYAAAYGWCVVRLTPAGKVDRVIEVPVQKPTKLAFGGSRLDTLYLTSIGTNLEPGSESRQPHAGGLFVIEAGTRGVAQAPFAG